ncbi:sirohydrochlorin chelatase [Microbacterium lushaniae]|uniref:Cobalamin biosynthesis protein CbiX n=1 Tax=Microbacterium lushaniae TaxID=2614639 RepID=A0A5J6L6S5_9MICO|nr:cobalamin biosynthesis protein CbiX [Microbacterium lushaniae]QEW04135.1 cobalamin biosynthesis protein CbiX [Microbacterium lushaniae]
MTGGAAIHVVLVGGHEAAQGADLARIVPQLDHAHATAPGRGLHNVVSELVGDGARVVVVPMTFGRDPVMVADTAKTLKWLAPQHPGRLALARPFGQLDHLTAWLRTAANRARAVDPEAALLIVAPRSNPFDEAELHRVAYLVSANGALPEVAVAIGDAAEAATAAERLHTLGRAHVIAVPAGLAEHLDAPGAEFGGPLLSDAAIVRTVRTRVQEAAEALDAGEDGIDAGLLADHGHGYAHSHAFEEGHAHAHPHTHSHGADPAHDHTDTASHSHDAHAHTPASRAAFPSSGDGHRSRR